MDSSFLIKLIWLSHGHSPLEAYSIGSDSLYPGALFGELFFEFERYLRRMQFTLIDIIITAIAVIFKVRNLIMDFFDSLFENLQFVIKIVDIDVPPRTCVNLL